MSALAVFFIGFSIVLSASRNLFSKRLSGALFGSRQFFIIQANLFLSGGTLLLIFSLANPGLPSPLTLVYSLCYGALLISAQWLYTIALRNGNIGICSTVYSFGFVLPTVAGVLFWQDSLSTTGKVGIFLVLLSILLSGFHAPSDKKTSSKKTYLFPLLLAMLSSGGLGIMQKIQQNSPFPEERILFVAIAFLFAGLVSLFFGLFVRQEPTPGGKTPFIPAILTGLAFSGSNLLNTTLAGMVPLTVFPPILNIGTIVASSILGIFLFREKPTRIDWTVLCLGILAILLLGFPG